MIRRVGCSLASFHTVELDPAFNLVVADRENRSGDKDTRNGAGKSLLLDVVHFCLGSRFITESKIGRLSPTKARFWLDIEIDGQTFRVSRGVDEPENVFLDGLPEGWAPETEQLFGELSAILPVKRWNEVLGERWFGLPSASDSDAPSFRALMQFFVRTGLEGYLGPFVPVRQMAADQRRMLNSFLLGLDWELATRWRDVHKREQELKNTRASLESKSTSKTYLGRLESELVDAERDYERTRKEIASFKVIGQYTEIQIEADVLTRRMQERQNTNFVDAAVLKRYEQSVVEEPEADPEEIRQLYAEAGVAFGEDLMRKLTEVQSFHKAIVASRKSFVQSEMNRLQARIRDRDLANRQDDDRRSELMNVLQSGGALEEYSALQQVQDQRLQRIATLRANIEKALEADRKKTQIDEEKALLRSETFADFEGREQNRREAIGIFSEYLSRLFDGKGRLVIDTGDSGYEFETDVDRETSEAVDKMTIFCYDLMLARLWANKKPTPGLLYHDSTMFEGWDERQIGSALRLAFHESSSAGFQYLACFNTDAIPSPAYLGELEWETHVRLRLNDTDEGALMGFRY